MARKKKTTETFIEECKSLYGDEFLYDKVKYVGSNTKVTITCKKHGDWDVRPYSFLQGHKCPKCGKESMASKISSNTKEFIEKAKKIHGDKYNYSKVDYINNRTKVCIICPKHGEFWQTPFEHLQGHGCSKCNINGREMYTTEYFIEVARKIHGDKYNYDKVVYEKCNIPVIINCPIHGDFLQKPVVHLMGCGCPKCATDKKRESYAWSTEKFIQEARKIHGDTYDYSKVNYINNYTPVTIICPIHGEFQQIPSNHLSGAGCSKCTKTSKGEKEIMHLLDFNNIKYITQYKLESKVNPSGYMLVDFYLPQSNIFIEYNGEQHYIPVESMGGQLQFEQQQARDEELRQYCKDHNIKLIEIRYDQDIWVELEAQLFNENINNP